MISVDDPAAMNMIYGFKPIYQKASFDRKYWRLMLMTVTDCFLSHC